jgi:hypothetical protein
MVESIKPEMTLAEVEAILGKGVKKRDKVVETRDDPNSRLVTVHRYFPDSIEIYVWERKDRGLIVVFDNGTVLGSRGNPEMYTWGLPDDE